MAQAGQFSSHKSQTSSSKTRLECFGTAYSKEPDLKLKERAEHFGVHTTAIWYATPANEDHEKKRCDPAQSVTRKGTRTKTKQQRYRERNCRERQEFLKQLRQIVQQQGSENLIYIDECGFDNRVYQNYGYAKRGKKLYGSRTGKRTVRENLVAARRDRELLAPMLIKGSVNAVSFEQWLEQWLCQELYHNSTLIMDNAPIHPPVFAAILHRRLWGRCKNKIEEIAGIRGHQVLFLPKYSPVSVAPPLAAFNSIEHDFAAMKKKRIYAPEGTSVADIVKDYSERNTPSKVI